MFQDLKTSLSLYLPATLLSLAGLLIIYSTKPELVPSQLVFICFSTLASIAISRLKLANGWIPAKFWLALVIISLIATSLFGLTTRGSQRWLIIFNQRLQTSEFAKIGLTLYAATYFAKHSSNNIKFILHFGLSLAIPLLIILRQPDLGTAIMIGVIGLVGLISAGIPFKKLSLIIIGIIVISPLVMLSLKPYQINRLTTFFNPESDPLGSGYNARQATIAVGSGQFLGRGLGQGTQSHLRFLPERHTDFIFASLVEELGFIGGSLIILIYGWLSFSLIQCGRQSESTSHSLVCLIFTGLMICQASVNIGMNMGILPITGVTLPFVSYGGSSLLATYLLLGICRPDSASASTNLKQIASLRLS